MSTAVIHITITALTLPAVSDFKSRLEAAELIELFKAMTSLYYFLQVIIPLLLNICFPHPFRPSVLQSLVQHVVTDDDEREHWQPRLAISCRASISITWCVGG